MQSLKQFIAEFEECCSAIEDSRQASKIDYPIVEILFLAIVAMAARAMSCGHDRRVRTNLYTGVLF